MLVDKREKRSTISEELTQLETSFVSARENDWLSKYDVFVRWILIMWVTSTRQFLWNMQQQVFAGLRWLLAGHGEYQHAMPVSLASPLRRLGSRRFRILRLSGGERNLSGVVANKQTISYVSGMSC